MLLDLDGAVKIGEPSQVNQLQLLTLLANIGDSFVANRQLDTENERCDIGSIGSVMMELMEPNTYIVEPSTIILRNPDLWKDALDITGFLKATSDRSLEELRGVSRFGFVAEHRLIGRLKHDFLSQEPQGRCLKSHVFLAVRAAKTNWRALSLQ